MKFKGINFYPEAVASVLIELDEYAGDYVCVREGDQLHMEIEVGDPLLPGLAERIGTLIRERLGVRVPVMLREPGALRQLTGSESRQKPRRLITR